MKDCGLTPMPGLSPAERAVKYIAEVLPNHPELSWYLCPGTTMFSLLCEAEAHRLGVEPDPDYKAGIYPSKFAEEYGRKLRPKDPSGGRDGVVDCPECGSPLKHECDFCGWESVKE